MSWPPDGTDLVSGKWVIRMLAQAETVLHWSRCPTGRQHGCVLAADGKRIVATGYNGTGEGMFECACIGEPKEFCAEHCLAIHAEINAIINAARVGAPVERCVAYVTKEPCTQCFHALINAGILLVYFKEPLERGEVEYGVLYRYYNSKAWDVERGTDHVFGPFSDAVKRDADEYPDD